MMETVRILSIDGGGVRGLIPARVVQEIEYIAGEPAYCLFDLIAGTSTGGIIACGLAKPNPLRAEELVELYAKRGGEIFQRRSLWHGVSSLAGMVDEKYPAGPIEAILEDKLDDAYLSDAITHVLVPAYDIERRQTYFFKSWKARGKGIGDDERASDHDFLLRDVARATSAAPTYFEAACVPNRAGGCARAFVDGGVFANNPAMCAYAAARKLYPDATNFILVSLGTGEMQRPIPHSEARDWGLLAWARPLLAIIFDGQSDSADYQLRELFPEAETYFRIQVPLGRNPNDRDGANDDMDDTTPDNLDRLIRLADRLVATNRQRIEDIVAGVKPASSAAMSRRRPPAACGGHVGGPARRAG